MGIKLYAFLPPLFYLAANKDVLVVDVWEEGVDSLALLDFLTTGMRP